MSNNFTNITSCKALWRFESGALISDSRGGHTLTDNNTVQESTTDYMEGSCAAYLQRSNLEYFNITNANLADGFPLKNNDTVKKGTFCFWYKPASIPGYSEWHHLFGKNEWGNNRSLFMGIQNGGELYVEWPTTAQTSSSTGNIKTLVADRKYHIACVVDGVNKLLTVYVWDDTAQTLTTFTKNDWSSALNVNDKDFCIGNSCNDTCCANGRIDEFVVFNSMLNGIEIERIRQGTYDGSDEVKITSLYTEVEYVYLDPNIHKYTGNITASLTPEAICFPDPRQYVGNATIALTVASTPFIRDWSCNGEVGPVLGMDGLYYAQSAFEHVYVPDPPINVSVVPESYSLWNHIYIGAITASLVPESTCGYPDKLYQGNVSVCAPG